MVERVLHRLHDSGAGIGQRAVKVKEHRLVMFPLLCHFLLSPVIFHCPSVISRRAQSLGFMTKRPKISLLRIIFTKAFGSISLIFILTLFASVEETTEYTMPCSLCS